MTLQEMSVQYRKSGESCRRRVKELSLDLGENSLSETERIALRRRACILDAMARDALAISRYLENYYCGGRGR